MERPSPFSLKKSDLPWVVLFLLVLAPCMYYPYVRHENDRLQSARRLEGLSALPRAEAGPVSEARRPGARDRADHERCTADRTLVILHAFERRDRSLAHPARRARDDAPGAHPGRSRKAAGDSSRGDLPVRLLADGHGRRHLPAAARRALAGARPVQLRDGPLVRLGLGVGPAPGGSASSSTSSSGCSCRSSLHLHLILPSSLLQPAARGGAAGAALRGFASSLIGLDSFACSGARTLYFCVHAGGVAAVAGALLLRLFLPQARRSRSPTGSCSSA